MSDILLMKCFNPSHHPSSTVNSACYYRDGIIALFDEHKSGELCQDLENLPDFVTQLIKAITEIVLMFYLSVKLDGFVLGGVAITFLLSAPMGKLFTKTFWWPPKDKTTYRVGFFKSLVNSGFFSFVFGVWLLSRTSR
ncbi:hypothetical protein ACHAWO_013988 [Cyclotella atomus]|uniref:Uncharacterized protein n=1 Tax=Cyclotella atomus TaxID=382360 RepID=A0ABD3MXE7_9STRA